VKTLPSVEGVRQAATRLADVIRRTPWEFNKRLSAMTDASVFIKREDLQQIRSFKIRGAQEDEETQNDKLETREKDNNNLKKRKAI